jgi:dTDP-4-dehydrorhamnose reductase
MLGSAFVEALQGERLRTAGRETLHVRRPQAVLALVGDAEVVINCAAHTDVEAAERDGDAAVAANTLLPGLLGAACRRAGATLVHVSSVGCYGDWKAEPYTEADPLRPTTAHHRSKAAGEVAVRDSGCEHLILRAGWLYGGAPGGAKNFVWKRLLEARTSARMTSDASQRGVPTFAPDMAREALEVLRTGVRGTYNLVAAGAASRFDYVAEIVRVSGLPCEVEAGPAFQRVAAVSPERDRGESRSRSVGPGPHAGLAHAAGRLCAEPDGVAAVAGAGRGGSAVSGNVILGAGVAGLGAAHGLRRRGEASIIYEARERAGGLLDNFTIESERGAFRFDTAVHLSFASEPEVREVFDRTPYLTHKPESLCYDAGYWLKHPVQNNLYALSAQEKVELIAGLAAAPEGEIANYRDWLVQQYGGPIAERWPLRYTEKYWTLPAERLGTAWVGQRMRRADIREVLQGAFEAETPNQYYVKEMRYPAKGGYRAFIEPLIEDAEIVYGAEAVEVDAAARTVRFADGRSTRYERLVSTLPLPRLAEMMRAPEAVLADAATLFASTVDLISIGFGKPKASPALWFYIYDEDILAARGYSPDWKSPDNVPDGCSSIQFEIYGSRERPTTGDVEALKRNTVEGVLRMGLASAEDILFVEHHHLPYGNVVFDLGMEARRGRVRAWVESQGVQTAGRFGEWDYLWSNQSMMSGMRAAEAALNLPRPSPAPAASG